MKKLTGLILILVGLLIIIIITYSCSESENKRLLLHQAELLSDVAPANSLILLDSIRDPKEMAKKDYMKYLVIRTKAKFKTYQDISSDTTVFEAAAYFDEHPATPALKATANNQAALVLFEKKEYDEAMRYLLKAEEYAQISDSAQLLGLTKSYLGETYYRMNNSRKAIPFYREAHSIYKKLPDEGLNQLISSNALATGYGVELQLDSALFYNREALSLAKKIKHKKYELQILNSLGVDYRLLGEPLKSKQSLLEAIRSEIKIPQINARIFLNLSKVYLELNQLDSANYFIKLSFQKLDSLNPKDSYLLLSAHKHFSFLKEKSGNYHESLIHYQKYNKLLQKIKNKDRSQELVRLEKKYLISQKEKELVRADLRAQIWLSIALGSIVVIVASALAIIIIRNKHQKEKQKNIMLDKQIENILFVNKLYKFITAESNTFEREVSTLSHNYSIKENSKGYGIIENMWKSMKKQTQDKMNQETIAFLKEKSIDETVIDSLTTPDLLYISLSQCNYEFKDIATMLGVKPNALHMRKLRLREKLTNAGIPDDEISRIISN